MRNFRIPLKVAFILTGWLLPAVVCAQETQVNSLPGVAGEQPVSLIIKPHICVAPRGESSCISRIDVSWYSEQPLDLCLYVNEQDQSLLCWQQQRSGTYSHQVTLLSDLEYWLAKVPDNHLLARTLVKFAALQPHRKHNRRRNLLPWSIQSL
jgi:hypothetical protein